MALGLGRGVGWLRGDVPWRFSSSPTNGRGLLLVYLDHSDTLVQSQLLAQGDALVSATVTNKDCALVLAAAEAAARQARRGTWANPLAIKNAESPDDILAGMGRLSYIEARFCRCGGRGRRRT